MNRRSLLMAGGLLWLSGCSRYLQIGQSTEKGPRELAVINGEKKPHSFRVVMYDHGDTVLYEGTFDVDGRKTARAGITVENIYEVGITVDNDAEVRHPFTLKEPCSPESTDILVYILSNKTGVNFTCTYRQN